MIKRLLPAIALALLLNAPASSAETDDFLIVPGERVGPITKDASEASLRAIYGADRVRPHLVGQGEGRVCRGAIIEFDKGEHLEVEWLDAEARAGVGGISVKGRRWRTREGIGLGTTLKELERLNGKPFRFSGFEFDYSGHVGPWDGGRLENLAPYLMLDPGRDEYEQLTTEENLQVLGGITVSSSNPVAQKLKLRVGYLRVSTGAKKSCESFKPG